MSPVTTRFAPSPTGLLHLGHARAASLAWRHARATGGRVLLRIEDIDPDRCRPEYTVALLEDLAWLGLQPDGPVRTQSHHLVSYQRALHGLAAQNLVYPCFCTRAEIAHEIAQAAHAPHTPDGTPAYPGTCRALTAAARAARLAAGIPHAWRLDMTRALEGVPPLHFTDDTTPTLADPAPFGDVVLARRTLPASYHLCCVYDDALQGVSLVTRAEDLRPATHLHRLLQYLLGLATPRYLFHPLLTDAAGRRLSKRDGAVSLRAMRERGVSAETVLKEASGPF